MQYNREKDYIWTLHIVQFMSQAVKSFIMIGLQMFNEHALFLSQTHTYELIPDLSTELQLHITAPSLME